MSNALLIDRLLYQFPLSVVIGILMAACAVALGFVAKQFLNDPLKKAQDDKVLLKELLEGFGLEVPAELKEADGNVIKPIKTS